MDKNNKSKLFALIGIIAFVTYNVVFFILNGFSGHTAIFWLSWVFMMIAFAAMGAVFLLLGKKGMFLRDWFFGYPIVKHTAVYIAAEFILSTLFVIFSSALSWKVPTAAQFLLLAIYLVFAISCFVAKDTIGEVKEKVGKKTQYFKLLRIDAEMLVSNCDDDNTKKVFETFAENVRNSDPMSHESISELEEQILVAIKNCNNAILTHDYESAVDICKKTQKLLDERNQKCMALK